MVDMKRSLAILSVMSLWQCTALYNAEPAPRTAAPTRPGLLAIALGRAPSPDSPPFALATIPRTPSPELSFVLSTTPPASLAPLQISPASSTASAGAAGSDASPSPAVRRWATESRTIHYAPGAEPAKILSGDSSDLGRALLASPDDEASDTHRRHKRTGILLHSPRTPRRMTSQEMDEDTEARAAAARRHAAFMMDQIANIAAITREAAELRERYPSTKTAPTPRHGLTFCPPESGK